jgi:hypothetical protein
MTDPNSALELFFRDYAIASIESPAARIPAFYADSFLVCGSRGSAVFNNDDKFVEWLNQLHEFNQRTGMISMEVVSVEEPLLLSDRNMLVRVNWGSQFKKTGDRPVTFRIAYLLETLDNRHKILAYVSEKDQEEEMRKLGIL